jgi:hypothetical protein
MEDLCDDLIILICNENLLMKLLLRKTSKRFLEISFLNPERNYINSLLFFCQKNDIFINRNVEILFENIDKMVIACSQQPLIWFGNRQFQPTDTFLMNLPLIEDIKFEKTHLSPTFIGLMVGDTSNIKPELTSHGVQNIKYQNLRIQSC